MFYIEFNYIIDYAWCIFVLTCSLIFLFFSYSIVVLADFYRKHNYLLQCCPTLWLLSFKFTLVKVKWNLKFSSQSSQLHFKYSVATFGPWLPYWTVKIHFHRCRKFLQTVRIYHLVSSVTVIYLTMCFDHLLYVGHHASSL